MFAFLNALTRTTSGKAFKVYCSLLNSRIGRGQKEEESISIAEGGGFIAQVNRGHKTNKQWN